MTLESFRRPSLPHGHSLLLKKPFVCASEKSWALADAALSMPAAWLQAASVCLEARWRGGYLNLCQLRVLCWFLTHLHHLLKGMYKLDVGRNIKGYQPNPQMNPKLHAFSPYTTHAQRLHQGPDVGTITPIFKMLPKALINFIEPMLSVILLLTVASILYCHFHSYYSSTCDSPMLLWLLFVLPWLSFSNLPCHFYPGGEVSRFLDKGNVSFLWWEGA